jgi:hypothetical protein
MSNDAARALRADDDGRERAELLDVPARHGRDELSRARERRLAERNAARRAATAPPPTRSAPGRAYGTHSRADVRGAQPGRRTVELTGYAVRPRRRSPTTAAVTSHPDRVALYAFLLGLFLVVMAIATAHG